jgi:hypothetical protein
VYGLLELGVDEVYAVELAIDSRMVSSVGVEEGA